MINKSLLTAICAVLLCSCSKVPVAEDGATAEATPMTIAQTPPPESSSSSPIVTAPQAMASGTMGMPVESGSGTATGTTAASGSGALTGTAAVTGSAERAGAKADADFPTPTPAVSPHRVSANPTPGPIVGAKDIISIQFTNFGAGGHALGPEDEAGAVSVARWIAMETGGYFPDVTKSGIGKQITVSSSNGVVNSNGDPRDINLKLTSYGYYGSNQGRLGVLSYGGATTSGAGGPAPLPVVLDIIGLNPSHTYTFMIYTSGGPSNLTYASISMKDGPAYYFETAEGDGVSPGLSDLVNNSAKTDVFANLKPKEQLPTEDYCSNYIQFDHVTGKSSVTFALTELGSFPNGQWTPAPSPDSHVVIGIDGVQVIDMGRAGGTPVK
jgi:hypothetical protein